MSDLLSIVEVTRTRLNNIENTRAALQSLGVALVISILVPLLTVAVASYSGRSQLMSSSSVSVVSFALAILAGIVVWLIVRPRKGVPSVAAALWIEEQGAASPSFALVTLVEQAVSHFNNQTGSEAGTEGDSARGGLKINSRAAHSAFASSPLYQAASRAVDESVVLKELQRLRWSRLRPPFIFSALAFVVLVIPWVFSQLTDKPLLDAWGTIGANISKSMRSPLLMRGGVSVRVTPPAYAGLAPLRLESWQTVKALSGSAIELIGSGDVPEIVSRNISSETGHHIRATGSNGRWSAVLTADSTPSVLSIGTTSGKQQVIIEGYKDSIPRVIISLPEHDSVWRTPVGQVNLKASAQDDLGLTGAWFELLITSGEGERFTVRSLTLGKLSWDNSVHMHSAQLSAVVDLTALALAEGDVIHIRAVARDGNPASGRELGSSETRSLRIARRGEYDSVSVEPAPPPDVDKSLLSQRMLLMLTEKLDARQKKLERAQVIEESQRIARDQARLRQSVGDIVFQRLSGEASGEHSHYPGDGHDHGVEQQGGKLAFGTAGAATLEEGDDSPVIAINKPLLEAYNAMWDAGRALEQGDPHGAIPAMRRALDAIESSRTMSRIYLRGKPPVVVLDLAKVRLAGKDTGVTASRPVRSALPTKKAEWDSRLVRAAGLLAAQQASSSRSTSSVDSTSSAGSINSTVALSTVRDSLTLLRVEALEEAPAFANAIERILLSLEKGGDVTGVLIDARRTLHSVVRTEASHWSRSLPP